MHARERNAHHRRWLLGGLAALMFVPVELLAQGAGPERVLVTSNRDNKDGMAIYTMDPDGANVRRLTTGNGLDLDPALSPDGKLIAFASIPDPAQKTGDLYVMKSDGTERKKLTAHASGTIACSPTWSPDGKRIAFTVARIEGNGPPRVALNMIESSGQHLVDLGEGGFPSWSPDGKHILYTIVGAQFEPKLHVREVDGSNIRQLIPDGKSMMGVWSPDGKRIACMAEGPNDQPDLCIINADGTNKKLLTTTTEEMEIGPRWSQDGKRIFFARISKGGPPTRSALNVTDADGTSSATLIDDGNMNFTGGGGFFALMRLSGG